MYRITVIMSTYNGEKYLPVQIDSILAQMDVEVILYVRDDGSCDGTHGILEKYASEGKLIWTQGKNVGPAESFINALFDAPKADFYAFADQDDYWYPDKLITGIRAIQNQKKPALYSGLAGLADSELNEMPNRHYQPLCTLGGALVTSATGCTMVFNQEMMDIARIYRPDCKQISMHDAWLYRVAYAMNAYVVYDPVSHMKYRQHGRNVSGGSIGLKEKLRRILHKETHFRLHTSQELYRGYGDRMCSENRKLVQAMIKYCDSIWNTVSFAFNRNIRANAFKTTVQIKFLILLRKL